MLELCCDAHTHPHPGVSLAGYETALFICSTTQVTFHEVLTQLQVVLRDIQQQHPEQYQSMQAQLLRTGFAVTPRSERGGGTREYPAPMAICTGVDQTRAGKAAYYQTNNMVQHHIPSDAELDALLIELRTFLFASGIGPFVRIVTLVRSIRDGYLPRYLWRRVETSVLETLAMLLPHSHVVMDGRLEWD